jgi:dipeptidyl aminopeptidase/acylaminoacyl peptidase
MAGLAPSAYRFAPRLVEYPTFDGRRVPAWLYLPTGREPKGLPFVMSIHGGPTAQARPGFSSERAYLLSLGFGVLAPNVRGSTGFGREWRDLDDYTKRLDSVKDAKAGADWLVAQGFADPRRIAVTGGSYGGYMVLALLTEYPDAFAAGADTVGIANFETFLERTAPYRRANRESEYGPLTDRAFLRSISPIHKADLIRAPLLIAHGERDPRVPVGEARQIEAAIRARGGVVEALYWADEGHGLSLRAHRREHLHHLGAFLVRHLERP